MAGTGKRESLIDAAASLFHRKGLEHTSIADIAAAAEVPLGNVYYYFKTRGDLVKSVAERWLAFARARRSELEALESPRARLLAFLSGFESVAEERTQHGCPVGGMCQEANKLGGSIALDAASMLCDTLGWLDAQFRAMGLAPREAKANAAHMLGAWQGSILLSNTFKDPEFIRLEIARLKKWLGGLPAGKERKKS